MHEWGDSGITAVLLAIGVALLLSLFVSQQARTRAARYKEVRRLQSVAADEARREEEEAHAEYTSMLARNCCAVCLNASTTRCSRCKVVRYCSSSCQVQHWKDGHKQECRAPDPVPSPVSSSNASRKFSDVYSSNGSPGSGGSRTLSEVSEVHILEDATALAELANTAPVSNGNGVLLKPKMVLFPYDYFVKFFNWERLQVPPCGLLNCGNSCFANVVLQCLTYTRPLTAYLLEGTHGEECRRSDWCFMCELQDHVWRVRQNQNPFSPIRILSRIRNIGNHLGYGRQEDAHEFMRFAIDSMQSICLDEAGGEKNIDPRSQETTFIHYIFGGLLQSQVKCMQCLHDSNRYENMMDLAVEIQGCVETLEDALTQFTAPEWLDGENKYKCDRCNDYVKARKRLTLHEAPNILTIALKRFQSGKFGKLNKRVTFPEVLDVSPYMSGKGDRPPLYRLYAVVVHVDMLNASFFGHYICYVKDSQGSWYKIDDSKVKEVDIEKVMAQRAYMLFYTRSIARPPPLTDGALSPYPVAEAADLVKVALARHTGTKVFPGSQYLESEEILEGAGSQGLHAMVDFNQMLDYNDGKTETVSEHILSNGEISTINPSSWEVERIGSSSPNDDEIELEDAGCIASSSNVTQTSPYMSSFTSNHGLWIPTQGYVCQVPEPASVDGTEYAPWDPKSSLPDDFSEVSLQPCTVEQPCSTYTGKRRLEDGLTPLPTPKPLDTDQLPAWPIGSPGRSNSCPPPIHHFSAVPSSSSMSDGPHSLVQKYELAGKPLTSETFLIQKTISSDLVSLPALGESSPESEMTDNIVVETTDSGDEKAAGRAKRQHVEVDRVVDPLFEVQRPDETLKAVEHSRFCDSEVRDMDCDAASEHSGSLTAGAEPCEEDPSADIASMRSSHGQVILNRQVSLPFASEGSESLQKEALEFDEYEEPHEGLVVIPHSSEALQLGSQPHSGLQQQVLGTKISFPEVTRENQASQPGVEDAILETGSSNHESGISLPTESDSKNASSTGAQTDSASIPLSNGPALQVADKRRPKSSKSPARPLFAPGFLNKPRTPSRLEFKSSSSTSRRAAAVENAYEKNAGFNPACENGAAMDQTCSSNGKSHVKDVKVTTGSVQLLPTQGISLAAVNDDTPTAPNGKVSSFGNNNSEVCNSAKLDSQSQNKHQTESVAAPYTKENYLAKILSKNDLGYSSKSTRRNASGNGNGSSLNSLQVNIDEEPSVEPVSEAVAVSGRPATGKQKQGRNETCNCGSQRKWKKCCGKTGVIKPEVGRRHLVV